MCKVLPTAVKPTSKVKGLEKGGGSQLQLPLGNRDRVYNVQAMQPGTFVNVFCCGAHARNVANKCHFAELCSSLGF